MNRCSATVEGGEVDTARDAPEISALINALGDALHARDLEASMALLAPDADLAVIPSEGVEVYRGPEQVRAFFRRIYDGSRRYGWHWNDRWISVVGSTAWFVAVGDESVEEEDRTRTIPYCLTGVAVRARSGWRLRLLHASEDAHA